MLSSNAYESYQLFCRGRDRADFHDEIRAAEVSLQRQQDEVVQRDGVIARLTTQVDKMRGDSVYQRIKLDDLRNQRTALR